MAWDVRGLWFCVRPITQSRVCFVSQDHNGRIGDATNFDSITLDQDWRQKLWPSFREWAIETFEVDDPREDGPKKAGKVKKQKKDFGEVLTLDETTGLPLITPWDVIEDIIQRRVVQLLQHMVREFITYHYGTR